MAAKPGDPSNFEVTADRQSVHADAIKYLSRVLVAVGVPSDDEQPHNQAQGPEKRQAVGASSIGNATLAYIHENGSPINHIPARPFLIPGVTSSRAQWTNYLHQAARLALDGNQQSAEKALNAAGITAVSAVKGRIQSKIPPPLSAGTIAARQRRYGHSADTTPLIDTGQLVNSISYVIRKGK